MTDNEPLPGITFVKRCSHRTTLSYFRLIIGERNDVIGDHHVDQRTTIDGRLATIKSFRFKFPIFHVGEEPVKIIQLPSVNKRLHRRSLTNSWVQCPFNDTILGIKQSTTSTHQLSNASIINDIQMKQ